MNILELDQYKLSDAVKFNKQLNPKLWGKDEHLKPEVREQLLRIADDFREFLGINNLQLKDITVSGSNAAYTYTPHSDIDLHLVVDLPEADSNEIYRELFDAKKYQYNDMHNIKIGGYDVELYVQNANQPHHSQGIYSVSNNEWIDIPKRRRPDVNDISTRSKYEDVSERIDQAIKTGDYTTIAHMAEKIREMRQAGLDAHGEFGPENLAFKMLRSQGKIKELYDARNAAKDRELSLKERAKIKQPVKYGFQAEDNGAQLTPDGVSPDTKMFLSEQDPEPTDEEILMDFIDFCVKELKIDRMPTIKLRRDPQWSVVNQTFGRYIDDKQLLEVAWGQRHIMDVLRTVAHELTHKHQHEREDVPASAGETGSEYENEANARAGILMRDYARLHPEFFAQGQAEDLHGDEIAESASGYIPTKKQAKDPRFSTALTVDIKPGQLGKEANKLKLRTDKQGHPQVAKANGLFEELRLQLEAFKSGEELDEVKMSPTALKKFADSPAAKGIMVGFEAEMIVPDVATDEDQGEMEADYDADERCTSIQQIIEFFEYDEFGYGISGRDAEKLQEQLDEAYYEWHDEKMYSAFRDEAEDLIKKIIVEDNWDWDEEVRKQLDMMEITGADQDAIMQAGAEAPTFKTSQEQQAYMADHPEYEKYIEAYEEAEGLLDDLVDDEVRTQDKIWDQALDDFRDDFYMNDDSDFFSDVGLNYMSDVMNRYDLYWPYMNFTGGTGSQDIDSVADDLSQALGMPVIASYSYHGATRKPGQFIIEPDGSLSPDGSEDGGLEIISPPMPIAQAMEKLNQVIEWAQARGCYTNSSTGLHMGVSLPGQKSFAEAEGDEVELDPADEKPIDFMKLALFLGDQHVLREFGRTANSYCRSSLEKLKEKNWSPQQIATAMEKMRGNLINLAYKDLADRSPGRDSINMKDNYVEFRGAGGDYLSRESDEGMDFLENTLLRYVQALAIAGDPNAYRDEYAKKLYKLISPEGDNTLDLFSKFATGEIDKEKLKTEWARKTLEKDDPSAVAKGNWVVVDNTTGKTVQGQEYSGYTEQEVRDRAKQKLSPGSSDQGFDQAYSIKPQNTGRWEVYRDDHGQEEQLEIIDSPTRGAAADQAHDTYTGVIPFKIRPYYGSDVVKPEPTRRAKLAKQIIQKPASTGTAQDEYRGKWEFFYEPTGRILDTVNGAGQSQAEAVLADVRRRYGDLAAPSIQMRKAGEVQDTNMDVAQNFAPSDATEQEGTWQIFDATLRQPVETFQGTWAQAERIAQQYETGPGERNGHEISVRRAG